MLKMRKTLKTFGLHITSPIQSVAYLKYKVQTILKFHNVQFCNKPSLLSIASLSTCILSRLLIIISTTKNSK